MPDVAYRPTMDRRFFASETKYSDIDWSQMDKAIEAFKNSLFDWYVRPCEELAKENHNGFAIMLLSCTLVDALSQYAAGEENASRTTFIAFVKDRFPDFANELPTQVRAWDGNKQISIITYSEALYYGFRCGIVHEAHVKLYTGIASQNDVVNCEPSELTKYDDGSNCPTVIIDPNRFFAQLNDVFEAYFAELLRSDKNGDDLRRKFAIRFKISYGIDLSTAQFTR